MIVEAGFEQATFKTLLEGYLAGISADDTLHKLRDSAWNHFLDMGLPTKNSETYKYIKLRHLFSQKYQFPSKTQLKFEDIEHYIYPECRRSVLVFVNGSFCPHLSNQEAIPSKISISTLSEATHTYGTFLHNHWNKSLKSEKDPFAVLNSALNQNGLFVYIPPKLVVETPIQILHVIDQANNELLMLVPRLNVFVGAQAQVNFVATQKSLTSSSYFVNNLVEMIIEESAHVKYTQSLCDELPDSWHLDAFRATLKANATLKTVAATQGSMTVRNDYHVVLAGENAEALLNGIWMLSKKREAHVNIFIDHQAPHCRSYQSFKGVINDFSRSSFEGKIMVRREAQKTEAFQLNNNLILSDYAHANSKPNLEIFADDVKASHGSTTGQLDPEQLIYMAMRGFDKNDAKNLLIYGFCEQMIDLIDLQSLKDSISERARNYLTNG